jgi:hypothetical protein
MDFPPAVVPPDDARGFVRPAAFFLAILFALVCVVTGARADDVAVPPKLQAELLGKVAGYDKNLAGRAGDKVHVLIVQKAGDESSASIAAHMQRELQGLADIGGLPHDEAITGWTTGDALAQTIKTSKIAIVYFSSGFRDDVDAIARALGGLDVLSAGAIADYVPKGVVLGFDLVSGKPKLLCNLPQAKKQNVAFRSEVLKLMKVFE